MRINIKFKTKILLILIILIISATLYSCFSDNVYVPVMMIEFVPPENAEISVRDIRVKGFTLDWTDANDNEYGYEYAIAVSHNGNIGDYEAAREHDNIVMDFTPGYMLNGTYRVTQLIPGKDYAIKIFIRARNIEITEYLKAEATLPYIDDAAIYSVLINEQEMIFGAADDSFSYYYMLGMGDEKENYTFTYDLMRGCVLYIDGKKVESKEIPLTPYEPLEVTVVHERTQAARDYIIYVGGKNNGIPVVVIDTERGRSIDSKSRNVTAHMRIIDSEYNPLGIGLYDGEIEIRGRGNSSWGMPKKSYNLFLPEKKQILDMAPGKAWVLMANYADKSLMRNYIVYEFARDLGAAMSPKMRHIDLILNGEFIGNYVIGERIKIDEGRLNFPKIKSDMTDDYELTGTYVLEINDYDRLNHSRVNSGELRIFDSPHVNRRIRSIFGHPAGTVVTIRQPSARNLPEAGFEYIRDYFNAMDDALFGDDFKDPVTGYRAYLDAASWVDWYLIHEFFKDVDGDFRLSTFLYKPRGGKMYMGPIWDFDLAAGNADYLTGDDPKGWYARTSVWYARLFEDEAFAQEFKDRWNYLKNNGYFDVLFRRIDDTAAVLEKSAEMNFAKWSRLLGNYTWPNANNWWERTTYQSEIDYLKDWLRSRFEWMDYSINTVRASISPKEKTLLDKQKYPNVRFGETSDILLLEVEWHTPETYSEYIEQIKSWNENLDRQSLRWLEENLRLLNRGRYYESRLVNGRNVGGLVVFRDERNITRYYDKDGYYIFNIYPYSIYVNYENEDGEYQYKSFGTAATKEDYDYVLEKELVPFCDDLLEKGLLTQKQYDVFTTEDPLDVWVNRLFN